MIGYLKGIIQAVSDGYIVVRCENVGYRVEVGETVSQYQEGEEREFYIYTYVRETGLKLFGFQQLKDLELFEMLLDVNGVGPKVAMQLISQKGGKQVIQAILQKDSAALKVSGVGIKTADKIILDLSDKLAKKGYRVDKDRMKGIGGEFGTRLNQVGVALKSLGYSASDVKEVILGVETSGDEKLYAMSVEELIKYLLSKM